MFTEMTKEEMAALIKEEIRAALTEASAPKEKRALDMTPQEFAEHKASLRPNPMKKGDNP